VIIALHHEQDMRNMGGLRRYMPITYWTSLIGSLALIGFPGFSGFFSKDALIEAVHASTTPGAHYAYWCVLLGVFVTALYSFRMFFLVFHGEERIDPHVKSHLHESPWVVTVPLIALAFPSVIFGWLAISDVLFGDFFADSIFVLEEHDVIGELGLEFHGPAAFVAHAFTASIALYLAAAGVAVAWFLYMHRPDLPSQIRERLSPVYDVLVNKYYFDWFNESVLARATRGVAGVCSKVGDQLIIDGLLVNGSAQAVAMLAGVARRLQTGYLYTYAFAMIIGLAALVGRIIVGQ
ncbi:MAG TPA: proton-conducting transporter membrane subunit, partial [Gammaproteobacteria bacterium]|nr:proton-conducting transporter membrane subunit [Gammaproteobacteria bacterium]